MEWLAIQGENNKDLLLGIKQEDLSFHMSSRQGKTQGSTVTLTKDEVSKLIENIQQTVTAVNNNKAFGSEEKLNTEKHVISSYSLKNINGDIMTRISVKPHEIFKGCTFTPVTLNAESIMKVTNKLLGYLEIYYSLGETTWEE